jgi:hypothetical protein
LSQTQDPKQIWPFVHFANKCGSKEEFYLYNKIICCALFNRVVPLVEQQGLPKGEQEQFKEEVRQAVGEAIDRTNDPVVSLYRDDWLEEATKIIMDVVNYDQSILNTRVYYDEFVLAPISCLFEYYGYKTEDPRMEAVKQETNQQPPRNEEEADALLYELIVRINAILYCYSGTPEALNLKSVIEELTQIHGQFHMIRDGGYYHWVEQTDSPPPKKVSSWRDFLPAGSGQ